MSKTVYFRSVYFRSKIKTVSTVDAFIFTLITLIHIKQQRITLIASILYILASMCFITGDSNVAVRGSVCEQ